MRKFTESLSYKKDDLKEIVQEMADEIGLEFEMELNFLYDDKMIPIHVAEVDMLEEEPPVFLNFKFKKNIEHFIDTEQEGFVKINHDTFNNFYELIVEMKQMIEKARSLVSKYTLEFDTFNEEVSLYFERENNFEDYYEIMAEQITDYVISPDRLNRVESKLTNKGYVIRFDIETEFKYFETLSDRGIAKHFRPNEYDNSKDYDKYVDEDGNFTEIAMNKEKWQKMSPIEKQKYWMYWLTKNIYTGLTYKEMIPISEYEFEILEPIDESLKPYYPN